MAEPIIGRVEFGNPQSEREFVGSIEKWLHSAAKPTKLRLWVCTNHDAHYGYGSSLVLAPDETEARRLLDEALVARGLSRRTEYTLEEVDTAVPQARVLWDGNQ